MNMLSGAPSLTANNTYGAILGADGLIFILVFLFGTYFTWWAVGILKWDKFTHDPYGPQARMLRFIMAVVGGTLFGAIALVFAFAAQSLQGALF